MDRPAWLTQKRSLSKLRTDTLFAPLYDEKWGVDGNATHQPYIQKFLDLLPQRSTILDAACGTWKYWSMFLENGLTVVGIDQS